MHRIASLPYRKATDLLAKNDAVRDTAEVSPLGVIFLFPVDQPTRIRITLPTAASKSTPAIASAIILRNIEFFFIPYSPMIAYLIFYFHNTTLII